MDPTNLVTTPEAAVPRPSAFTSFLEGLREKWGIIARNRLALLGTVIVITAAITAAVGPYVVPWDPYQPDLQARLAAPSWQHWFGTDRIGRDILSRVILGLWLSMKVASGAVIVAFVAGVPFGAVAAYYGKWVDELLMRLVDGLMSFPSKLLAIVMVVAWGASFWSLWVAIGITSMPRFARIIRAGVLSQKEKEYVEAARASGEPEWRILFQQIIPNCFAPLMVQASLNFGQAVLTEASLSFLGLGFSPPTISLGIMLKEAQSYMEFAWWTAVFPGLAIALVILGFNLLGDGLRDAFDPREVQR